MAKIYTIEQKSSGTGSIHDIASEHGPRMIKFAKDCKFAVVTASYYGGKGYTTHKTAEAAAKASKAQGDYSHQIIDSNGVEHIVKDDYYSSTLVRR